MARDAVAKGQAAEVASVLAVRPVETPL